MMNNSYITNTSIHNLEFKLPGQELGFPQYPPSALHWSDVSDEQEDVAARFFLFPSHWLTCWQMLATHLNPSSHWLSCKHCWVNSLQTLEIHLNPALHWLSSKHSRQNGSMSCSTKVPQAARLSIPPVAKVRPGRERTDGSGRNTSPSCPSKPCRFPLALKVGPAAVVVDY